MALSQGHFFYFFQIWKVVFLNFVFRHEGVSIWKKPSNEKYSSLHVVLFPVFKISVSSKLPELLPIKKMGLFRLAE